MRLAKVVVLAAFASAACSGASVVAAPPSRPVVATAAPPVADPIEALGDLWVGGFGRIDGDGGGDGAFLRVDFASGIARLHPSEHRAPLGIIRPKLIGNQLGFAVDDGKHRRTFQLQRRTPDTFEGTARDEKGAATNARLVRVATYERKAVDVTLAGTYAVDGDAGHLLFVDDGRLFDARDGTDRRLYLLGPGRALVGSGVATAHPSDGTIALDGSGRLHIAREGGPETTASRLDVKREEIRFPSAGAMLQGTLVSPPGAGPHPAVVYVHGSGHVTRQDPWENAMARVMLSQGYAFFIYDKRGVGDSTGEYVGPGGRDTNNVSSENLERLAGDVRAATAVLSARKDLDPTGLGLLGLSQAGWIAPLAAKGNKAVRFVVIMSGAASHTSVQLAYQSLNGPGEACLPIPEVDRIVHEHAPRTGLSSLPAIAALDVPALWLYGSADALIPYQESMRLLEPLKKNHDFTVTLVPNAGHELYVVKRDTEEERQTSPGFSPVALDALRTWLKQHVRPAGGPR